MKNILVVGSANTVVETLCKRLTREGNKVFVLSQDREDLTVQGVRTFHYQYDSDSVYEVFASCRLSCVIFLGACDAAFRWDIRTEKNDYRRFIAGVSNILRVAQFSGVERFLYLSSGEIFEEAYVADVREDTPAMPRALKGTAVAIGEKLVQFYGADHALDCIIARLDHLFFCPKDYSECTGLYEETCRKAVLEGNITINGKITRSALWVNDAVEAINTLVKVAVHSRQLYHVTSGEAVTESTLAETIVTNCTREVTVVDNTVGVSSVSRLADSYFAAEFGFVPHFTFAECTAKILQYMQNHVMQFRKHSSAISEAAEGFGPLLKKLIPYLEAVVVFVLVMLVMVAFGSSKLLGVLDLFLLYVLLFALVHGLQQAVFSAMLSMVGYFWLNSGSSMVLDLIMDIGTYAWIAQIFIVGMAVGYQRDTLRRLHDDKDEEIRYLDGRLEDISQINDSTTSIKNYFENQIITSQESLSFFYEIMSKLDAADDKGILFEVVQVLQKAMGTRNVAIYEASGASFFRLLSSTTTQAYELGRSLRTADFAEIFTTLERDKIFVNTTPDTHLPSMVSAIRNENGDVQMAIFLWDLPFDKMTLQNRNMLRILSLLIQGAMIRATRYMDAMIEKRYYPDTRTLNGRAFLEVEQIYRDAAQKHLVEYVLIRADAAGLPFADAHERVEKSLRAIDIVGYFAQDVYYAIAVNSRAEDSGIILDRFARKGILARVVEEVQPLDIPFTGDVGELPDTVSQR